MSAAQKLYPVILQPAEFIPYQAFENHLESTQSDKNNTNKVGTGWFRDKRRFVLIYLKECVTATANNLLTLRRTVKLSTLQEAVLQCLLMMFYKVDDANFCGSSNLARVSRQQLWLLCQKGVRDSLPVQQSNSSYMWEDACSSTQGLALHVWTNSFNHGG